jgi:hypothetical protein
LEERKGKKKMGIRMEPGNRRRRWGKRKAPVRRKQRRKRKEISQGLVRNFRKLQGPVCKTKISR